MSFEKESSLQEIVRTPKAVKNLGVDISGASISWCR